MEVKLDDDLGASISDGVLLCQLVNKLHPNSIPTVHVPRAGEVKCPINGMYHAALILLCDR